MGRGEKTIIIIMENNKIVVIITNKINKKKKWNKNKIKIRKEAFSPQVMLCIKINRRRKIIIIITIMITVTRKKIIHTQTE